MNVVLRSILAIACAAAVLAVFAGRLHAHEIGTTLVSVQFESNRFLTAVPVSDRSEADTGGAGEKDRTRR